MYSDQNTVWATLALATVASNADTNSDLIDTRGANSMTVLAQLSKPTANGTSQFTVFNLQSSPDTNTANFTTIAALSLTTTTGATNTSVNNVNSSVFTTHLLHIPLSGSTVDRYVRFQARAANTSSATACITVCLSRNDQAPTNATQAGVLGRFVAAG
jgi:hypothetical protein